jgi:alkanesulfonate monooxygenase SsuD/methylene tetrahydromethanopterin reductase-like flavin-dependent oxidoreductase (luciferase family)
LLIGGDGERRLLRIVAGEADEWNSHAPGPDAYRLKRARLEEHCRSLGRDPDSIVRSWMGGVLIAEQERGLLERGIWMKAFLSALEGVPSEKVPDSLRQRQWLVGTPEQVADQLRAWSAAGVQRVMLQWYDLDDLQGLELLAKLNSELSRN